MDDIHGYVWQLDIYDIITHYDSLIMIHCHSLSRSINIAIVIVAVIVLVIVAVIVLVIVIVIMMLHIMINSYQLFLFDHPMDLMPGTPWQCGRIPRRSSLRWAAAVTSPVRKWFL